MTSPCRGGFERVLYGWGKNAPAMSLPTGVGYGVGPGSAMQSLVLQVCLAQNAARNILLQITLSVQYSTRLGHRSRGSNEHLQA